MRKIIFFLIFFIIGISKSEEISTIKNKWIKKGKRDPFKIENKKQNIPEKIESIIIEEPPEVNITGILIGEGKRLVIVGDGILKEGDFIGKFQIKKILEDSIFLKKDKNEYIIFIKGKEND